MVRSATIADLERLADLEVRCFDSDRLSRRSFRRMITQAHADLLVHATGDALEGYALVLYHKGTHLARLYSIAVDPAARGRGVGKLLLGAAEAMALQRGCITMRLEIRSDNTSAANLYCSKSCRSEHRRVALSGPNAPVWVGGPKTYRGRDWQRTRMRVVIEQCGHCAHCSTFVGRSLPVNHIRPFREFQAPEEANRRENLIGLCQPCHMRAEPRPVRRTVTESLSSAAS